MSKKFFSENKTMFFVIASGIAVVLARWFWTRNLSVFPIIPTFNMFLLWGILFKMGHIALLLESVLCTCEEFRFLKDKPGGNC